MTNYYEQYFHQQVAAGASSKDAAEAMATAYLDGKPRLRGKKRITSHERDADFWTNPLCNELPVEIWESEVMVLALGRYFAQERTPNLELLSRIATALPAVVCRAVRYSELVLCQSSPRRTELGLIADCHPDIAELCRVLDMFELAHRDRLAAVAHLKSMAETLTPFDLLVLASLHAFEHLIPRHLAQPPESVATDSADQLAWDAINDIVLWRLRTAPESALRLSDASIEQSLAQYLDPLLSPSGAASARLHQTRATFAALLEAQIELNEFVSRSAHAFCYDDGIRFVRQGAVLAIEEIDPVSRSAWHRDGEKLTRLHEYWFYKALDEFSRSEVATLPIGLPENHEANRLAYINAMRTSLRLTQVYGVADAVTTEAGDPVNLFQALLSLELMSAFFLRDFIQVYGRHLHDTEDWVVALQRLIVGGFSQGFQNRLPVTWSDRDVKISRITGWTVTPDCPQGSPLMAARILDFWTSDWMALSAQMRNAQAGLHPELFERPVLKLGKCLVQLPWLVGVQNNSTAAINNLRRLGARRGEAREETQRIEAHLGELLEARGFKVSLNWEPPIASHGNAGEVDLICARDGVVLVLEVKSTFIRRSQRDAWLHATTTLRRAGQQLQRKVAAVSDALAEGDALAECLGLSGLDSPPEVHGWIVDTSIERDHQRFSGFLKLSLEEFLIALRDERELLCDPGHLFHGRDVQSEPSKAPQFRIASPPSLYPSGFGIHRFIEVIEAGDVWEARPA